MEPDVAQRIGDALRLTLRRLSSLAVGIAIVAAFVGTATFATGWWVFEGSIAWLVIGGAICLVPIAAAATAWLLLRITARFAPLLVDNVSTFLRGSSPASQALIDYDTGQTVVASSKSFTVLRSELTPRSSELPALYAGVRAITSVPALAAISVLGIIGVGLLGTVLLIGGLID